MKLTWEDLSEIRSDIRQNKQIDDEKIISLVDSVSHLWNKLLSEQGKVEEMQKTLEWAARIIDSGMYKGILQYDPKEWFSEYWKLKGESQ